MAQGEAQMWGDVFSGKNSVGESLQEAGFATAFAALWGPIAGLNKVIGCHPPAAAKTLDFSEPPVRGYNGK